MFKNITRTLLSLFCWLSINAHAQTSNQTLGVPDGMYLGQGKLISQSAFVPNLDYKSLRKIKKSVIQAHTKAYLFGIKVAEAKANLRVQFVTNEKFELLDIDLSEIKCGEGICDKSQCRFTATVMNGELTLTETWSPEQSGFSVLDGSQIFKNKSATYSGQFSLLESSRSKN